MSALDLNTLLAGSGLAPETAIVARHRPHEPALRKVMPWIAAEHPDLFKVYQQVQGVRLESAMTRAQTLISFLGVQPGQALFVGAYQILGHRPITYDEYWAMPENRELRGYGMTGLAPDATPPLFFELEPLNALSGWQGRLIVTWPGLERSWWRWAGRNTIPVHAITEESQLAKAMPSWDKLVVTGLELALLPAAWRTALSHWRGVYFIFDVAGGRGYVGSAYGADNILGRWGAYAATGHGGNVRLRASDPANLRFSILQRTSPDMPAEEVIALEGSWKDRLHTREHGLNAN